MPRHIKDRPSSEESDFSANYKRPAGTPSARELIADAAAARDALAGQLVGEPITAEHYQAKRLRHRSQKRVYSHSDERAMAAGTLPAIGQFAEARDGHGKKVATREAGRRAEDAN